MRRTTIVLGVALVLVLLASNVSLAAEKTWYTMTMPDFGLREMYDRSLLWQHDEGPVQLPRPIGDTEVAVNTNEKGSLPGPIAMAAETPDLTGNVFAQPRGGGSIYTDKQQADRDIRKMIRRLND